MAKIDRLERLDRRRAEQEAEYRELLSGALTQAAAGKAGLFNRRADKRERAAAAPLIDALRELGDEIDDLRRQLMIERFALHQQFFDARGRASPSAVGEPRQAAEWLERLAAEAE